MHPKKAAAMLLWYKSAFLKPVLDPNAPNSPTMNNVMGAGCGL